MPKIFRNYNTLSQFNSESVHPENKICLIKDKGVIYSNGVQYSPSKMDTISNIGDSDNIVDKFNELRKGLLESNLMAAMILHTVIYWTGNSNTINISGSTYTAEPDKINIDGVEYYQLKLDKDLDNDFYNFSSNTFTNLIFKNVDTSNVTNMSNMFYYCRSLTSLDVSKFDTSNVTNMYNMFNNCKYLTSLDLGGWNTSKVTNMMLMFCNCSALTSLDVSKFDTSNVTVMNGMFMNCVFTSLDVSKFDTSKVTNMNGIFNNCKYLTSLDLSTWDTTKVTDMSWMFSNCSSLTSLDISGWDISNVTDMNYMFNKCGSLKTIRMVGCSQTTIDKIKAQLSGNGITGYTIVTE